MIIRDGKKLGKACAFNRRRSAQLNFKRSADLK